MLTDKELAAVPEELLEDLLRYSEYGWRERRIATLLARRYPVALTEADVRKMRRLGQKMLRPARIGRGRPRRAAFRCGCIAAEQDPPEGAAGPPPPGGLRMACVTGSSRRTRSSS